MIRFIIGRTIQAFVTMFAISLFVFVVVRLGGDPVQVLLPPEAPKEQYEEMRQMLRLNDPWPVQYATWVSHIATGDFGISTKLRKPVMELVGQRMPATLQLAGVAFAMTVFFGLTIGVYSAAHRGSGLDVFARATAVVGQALPNFWLGIVLIMVFSVYLRWLPAGGRGEWEHLILPAICLGWAPVAGVMRLTRSSMIDVLESEYIKLAKIKGVSTFMVLWKHAFKNAALPVLTFTALILLTMVRGTVIVETVFAWPGIGLLVLDGINNRDFPIVQGVVLLFSSWIVFGNLIVDIMYAYVNPRIRY